MDRYFAIAFCALAICVMAFMMHREEKLGLVPMLIVIVTSVFVGGFMMTTLE